MDHTAAGGHNALTASMQEEQDPMRQRHSIATHPGYPIIVCSDGYLVSILQLPVESSCLSLMKALVVESNGQLRRIRDKQKLSMTLFDSLRQQGKLGPKIDKRSGRPIQRLGLVSTGAHSLRGKLQKVSFRFQFEDEPEDALNATIDSDIVNYQQNSPTKDLGDGGKIIFGDVDNLSQTVDFRDTLASEDESGALAHNIDQTQRSLLLAWGLAASHSGLWMLGHEELTSNVAHNLMRLFTAILHCSGKVLKDLDTLAGTQHRKMTRCKKSRNLSRVLRLFKMMLHLLQLDSVYRHLLVCAYKFVHSTVDLLLSNKDIKESEPRTRTLHGAYVLLRFCEFALAKVYTSTRKTKQFNSIPYELPIQDQDLYEAAVLVKIGLFDTERRRSQAEMKTSAGDEEAEGKLVAGSDVREMLHSGKLASQHVATELSQVKR